MFPDLSFHDAWVTAVVRDGSTIRLSIEAAEEVSSEQEAKRSAGYQLDGAWLIFRNGTLAIDEIDAIAASDPPLDDLTMAGELGEIIDFEWRQGRVFLGMTWLDTRGERRYRDYFITCGQVSWTPVPGPGTGRYDRILPAD